MNKKPKSKKKLTLYSKDRAVGIDDFEIKKVIGQGSFGKVYLVIKKDNGAAYAMKTIRKDLIIDNEQIQCAKLEKQVLLNNKHPFLVSMHYVFQDNMKVYFVMNLIRGGELYNLLARERKFSEERAKFYSIQLALAIGYLHKMGVVYRDIKPENILVGEDGYLNLTDFGLAKTIEANEMAQTFCGTPEYLAPEVLKEEGHSFTVDWWALGVLIYEMLIGFPPFYHKNQNKMFERIESKEVRFPEREKHGFQLSDEAMDLIRRLLCKDPDQRLGKL